jgi:hypothetical protein
LGRFAVFWRFLRGFGWFWQAFRVFQAGAADAELLKRKGWIESVSHFCRICPTFFAFCFWVIGNKLLKINSLDDIFERRAADGRDIGSSARCGPKTG